MFCPPAQPLPLPSHFPSPDEYISSLLNFYHNPLFQTLCGGVHILDFFTRDPPEDIYTKILPTEWRAFFGQLSIDEVLDVLLRRELRGRCGTGDGELPIPPSLSEFILQVRGHCLRREFRPRWAASEEAMGKAKKLRKQSRKGEVLDEEEEVLRVLTVGMKPKKMHEVENFAHLLHHLLSPSSANATTSITCPSTPTSAPTPESTPRSPHITHIADIGSGQGYLPRLLSSPSYGYLVLAIESKPSNISGAKTLDAWVSNRLDKRLQSKTKREEKQLGKLSEVDPEGRRGNCGVEKGGEVTYIQRWIGKGEDLRGVVEEVRQRSPEGGTAGVCVANEGKNQTKEMSILLTSLHSCGDLVHHALYSLIHTPEIHAVALVGCCYNLMSEKLVPRSYKPPYQPGFIQKYPSTPGEEAEKNGEKRGEEGEEEASPSTTTTSSSSSSSSCSPLPPLRMPHPRLISTTATPTHPHPHGFPLSTLFTQHNITLNITARMMACQAPQNWSPSTSTAFFTRHFYRALLQRVLVDSGHVSKLGVDGAGQPVILGSLAPAAYASWIEYVKAATGKLGIELHLDKLRMRVKNSMLATAPEGMGMEEVLLLYEEYHRSDYCCVEEEGQGSVGEQNGVRTDGSINCCEMEEQARTKKDKTNVTGYHALCVTWSLMAFCAGVVESLIVVDRWQWLREHMREHLPSGEEGEGTRWGAHRDGLVISDCWVEAAFEYAHSPRNLVVVGVKEGGALHKLSI